MRRFSWLLASMLALGALPGCSGGADTAPAAVPAAGSFSASDALPGAPAYHILPFGVKHGLGGKLDGTPVITFGQGGLADAGPAKIELRAQMSPVGNQGQLQSCCAFAVVKGLREYLLKREGKPATPLSPGFLWSLARKDMDYPPDKNEGVYVEVGMKVLQHIGTSPEADFPYIPVADQEDPARLTAFLTKAPSPIQLKAAQPYRIGGIQQANSLQAIKQSLAAGYPVIIGIFIYPSFYNMSPDYVAPVPHPDQEQSVGSHIVAVTGYDDARKLLTCKNSWGADWGDHGYFYLPYEYVKLGIARDAWTVKR